MQMDIWYDTILLEMSQEQHRAELNQLPDDAETPIEDDAVPPIEEDAVVNERLD